MSVKSLDLIGAGLGWGAQQHEAELGPQALKTLGLELPTWRCLLTPDLSSTSGKKLDYKQRVDEIVRFNERLAKQVTDSLHENHLPVIVGGDHSIAIGTWNGVVNALNMTREFGLIWIDAHMDAHTLLTTPSQAIHGMPVAVLLGEGDGALIDLGTKGPKIKPDHLVLIGVRSFERGEAELLKKLKVKIYYIEEVKLRGFKAVFSEAIALISSQTKGYGVSIDLDAFDPSIAPGVGTPEKNGLMKEEVCDALIHLFQDPNCKALEIAEFNPMRDIENKTAKLIQALILGCL